MYEAQLLEVLSGSDKRIYLPQIQKYARYSADFFMILIIFLIMGEKIRIWKSN